MGVFSRRSVAQYFWALGVWSLSTACLFQPKVPVDANGANGQDLENQIKKAKINRLEVATTFVNENKGALQIEGSSLALLKALAESAPPRSPIFQWITKSAQKITLLPNEVFGVAFSIPGLTRVQADLVLNDGRKMALAVDETQLAAGSVAFRMPGSIEVGIKDLYLRVSTSVLTDPAGVPEGAKAESKIEGVLLGAVEVKEWATSTPVSVKFNKRDIFTSGNDSAIATVLVRQSDGRPYPDGTLLYVYPSHSDTTQVDFADPMYRPFEGRPFERVASVKSGKIELRLTSIRKVSPSEYLVDPSVESELGGSSSWPADGHPSVQIAEVCIAASNGSLGYGCGQALIGAQALAMQPKLFLRDLFSMKVSPEHTLLYIGGNEAVIDVTLFDRAGLPVPNGTPIFLCGGATDGATFTLLSLSSIENKIKVLVRSESVEQFSQSGQSTSRTVGVRLRGLFSETSDSCFGGVNVSILSSSP